MWTVGPDRPLRVVDNIAGAWDGAQLTIHLKILIFCCPTFRQAVGLALSYATRFLSCLLFSAGFWAAIRPWRPLRVRIRHTVLDETGVAGVHSWSCEADQQAVVLLKFLDYNCTWNKNQHTQGYSRALSALQGWSACSDNAIMWIKCPVRVLCLFVNSIHSVRVFHCQYAFIYSGVCKFAKYMIAIFPTILR